MWWIILIAWTLAGLIYVVWNMELQFKKTKTALFPPQVWWEYIVIAPLYVVIIVCCLIWECLSALVWCISFGKIGSL
jgi:hypothetical protein